MTKILIVEDNQTILGLLKTLLELEGYQVFFSDEKNEIYQILSQVSPDLVLLDIHLRTDDGQEVSGYEILGHIRRTPEFKNIRVLMTSGIDLHEQALNAGADDFILKPYIPDDLVNSIQANIQ